jgi:DNA primase
MASLERAGRVVPMPLQTEKKFASDHAKGEIRARINIADIIGRHVALKPAGQSLKGLCPFHKEKTPSFIVTPAKGIFYCFGCHKGGDVFTFLMEHDGLSFPEALQMLAEEAGVRLEPQRSPFESPSSNTGPPAAPAAADARQERLVTKNEMLKINEMAMEFYYRRTRSFKLAIDYFLGRGLTRETIRDFRLGYAPPGWSEFLSYAQGQGVSREAVVQSGLAIAKPDGKAYDRFRDRIMFPIFDTSKRPIGFGGRGLTPDAEPKYLNSPETLLYQKNRTLYGLHMAQLHIKQARSVIIVEGYMDFLALYQAGIKNVIATSGTALTETQARIIQRFSPTVYLVFDGDNAGINAAKRAVFVLAPLNLDIRVLILPDEEDPDEYVKKHGREAFLSLLEKSTGFMRFIVEKTIADVGIDTPQRKSAALDTLVPLARAITDSIVRMEFVKVLSESLHIGEGVVLDRLKRQPKPDEPSSRGGTDVFFGSIEGQFLRLLVSDPSLIKEACNYITPETFTDHFSGDLFLSIVANYEKDPSLDSLAGSISDPEKKRIVSRLFAQGKYEGDAREDLRHSILRLQRKFLKYRRSLNLQRMKDEMHKDMRTSLLKLVGEDAIQQKEIETSP